MTRATNARIAGVAFLFYIVVVIAGTFLAARTTSGSGVAAQLASVAAHAAEVRVAWQHPLLVASFTWPDGTVGAGVARRTGFRVARARTSVATDWPVEWAGHVADGATRAGIRGMAGGVAVDQGRSPAAPRLAGRPSMSGSQPLICSPECRRSINLRTTNALLPGAGNRVYRRRRLSSLHSSASSR